MRKPRQASVVILITLAELAWLAAFGLLFAYRGKVGEVGALQRRVADVATAAGDITRLVGEREIARRQAADLQAQLDTLGQSLGSRSPAEVMRLLKAAGDEEQRARLAEARTQTLAEELAREQKAVQEARTVLAELQRQFQALPPNAIELAVQLRDSLQQLAAARAQMAGLSNRIGQLELGEVAIRRELIGLPAANLRRVVFIVDTSSSMRNSPAWHEARSLMRMWIEYLSVEECALVNFNDRATAFPPEGYQRVREAGGRVLADQQAALLAAFDRATPGTFSDLLKGLRLAYSRPDPDLIILLTDGYPHVPTQSDKSYGNAILREASLHSKVPILAVAVGGYEVEGAGSPGERRNAAISFLKSLARITEGGNFIGR